MLLRLAFFFLKARLITFFKTRFIFFLSQKLTHDRSYMTLTGYNFSCLSHKHDNGGNRHFLLVPQFSGGDSVHFVAII